MTNLGSSRTDRRPYFDADKRDGDVVARLLHKPGRRQGTRDELTSVTQPSRHGKTAASAQILVHQRAIRSGAEGRPVHRQESADRQFPWKPGRLSGSSFNLERGKNRVAGDHTMSFDLDLAQPPALWSQVERRESGAAVVETLCGAGAQVVATSRSVPDQPASRRTLSRRRSFDCRRRPARFAHAVLKAARWH